MKKIIRNCSKHGDTEFIVEKYSKIGHTRIRCKKCGYDRQLKAKRRRKRELVELAGGKCASCGYNRCMGALDFHHLDPNDKSFGIGQGLVRFSKEKLIEEMKKCVLLCKNCHAEVENGRELLMVSDPEVGEGPACEVGN